MRLKIKDLYSQPFGIKFIDVPHIDCVEGLLSEDPIRDTKYYKFMLGQLKKYGVVFDNITTPSGIEKLAENYRLISRSVKKGYNPAKSQEPITAVKKEGKFYLVDGHHRTSILYYLGQEYIEVKTGQATFFWDDGWTSDYNVIKPIFDQEGVKGVVCITTNHVREFTHMGWEFIKEMYNEGWEVTNHCTRHQTLQGLKKKEVRHIFSESQEEFARREIDVDNLVYPSTKNDQVSRDVASEFFKSAREGTQTREINKKPYDMYRISSLPIDYALIEHWSPSPNKELQKIKKLIKKTAECGHWVTFYGHSVNYGLKDAENLRDLIRYCKEAGLEIVTYKEALKQ